MYIMMFAAGSLRYPSPGQNAPTRSLGESTSECGLSVVWAYSVRSLAISPSRFAAACWPASTCSVFNDMAVATYVAVALNARWPSAGRSYWRCSPRIEKAKEKVRGSRPILADPVPGYPEKLGQSPAQKSRQSPSQRGASGRFMWRSGCRECRPWCAEVVWTRTLALMLGATVYTFSIILAVFLVGSGIGKHPGAR